MFQTIEETLNQIAGLIAMAIIIPRSVAIGARRDNRLGAIRLDALDQRIGIVALIGNHRPGLRRLVEERRRLGDVGAFTAREEDRKRVAEGVDQAVGFGAEAAARTATVSKLIAKSAAIALSCFPSAADNTIRQRCVTCCGVR